MPEQVAPPPAPDAATPEPAVETPQAAEPQAAAQQQSAEQQPAAETPQPAAPQQRQPAESEPAVETPQPAGQQPAEPQPAEPKAEKSGAKKALGIVGAILAVLVVAGLKFGVVSAIGNYFNKDETAAAKTGDCIAELPEVTGTEQEEVDGAKVVECTSTDAAYNVVGRLDGQSEAQAKADTTCTQFFKESEEGYVFSSIEPGKTGYVLCLTKKV
ncbi:LppU/SCO3897 family protein [Micromonospora trifolii]|uniref:LppU/SCO3897 family protein n=1 Tax=Micromonospora trifolii TaxID=2911208 RepID=UPI003CEC26CF